MLVIYYDGQCFLCCWEMDHLKLADQHNQIQLEDLHQPGFSDTFPHVSLHQAMDYLHGESQGQMFYGLDVTYQAWTRVGKRHWVQYLRWPLIRHLFNWLYLRFARHRQTLSRLIPLRPRCHSQQCHLKQSHDASRKK